MSTTVSRALLEALPKTEDDEIDREKVKKAHGAKY